MTRLIERGPHESSYGVIISTPGGSPSATFRWMTRARRTGCTDEARPGLTVSARSPSPVLDLERRAPRTNPPAGEERPAASRFEPAAGIEYSSEKRLRRASLREDRPRRREIRVGVR